jgi:hypothetical protein
MNAYVLFRGGKTPLSVVLGAACARPTPLGRGVPISVAVSNALPIPGPCAMEVK